MDKRITKTENWDEGLPLGNGFTGSIVYGGIGGKPLKITVDRTDLWDLRPNETTLEKSFNYKNLVKLSLSGKEEDWRERARLFENIFMAKPYPSKITAGRLELTFDGAKDLSYSLDYENAFVDVYADNRLIARLFISTGAAGVGVIKTFANFKVSIHVPAYLSGTPDGKSAIGDGADKMSLGYPAAVFEHDGNFGWYRQNTFTDYAFGIVTYKSGSELYYTLSTTDDNEDYIAFAKERLKKAAEAGFENLFAGHKKDWKAYWNKSQVKTGDKLIDETYKKSWYLFKSCSAKGGYPMPLQGVWTADNDCLPPWKGDYHHDTNTELSYQSYLKANRLKEGEAFIDYLWRLKPTYEKFAKEFFGVDGLLLPSCSTLDGKPMGGWAQYSLSPIMTVWAAQSFDEYYLYTDDKKFLKKRAYPFFKAVGTAIKSLLRENNGKYHLPLSSSPEIFDNEPRSYLEPNSNFDLALLIYLFTTLKKYSIILGEKVDEYDEILAKLDDIAIDGSGVVMLDKTQKLPETHRHFSHLMCLYPLHLINYDTEAHKRIYNATLQDLETLGSGMWVGFSFAMAAQIYAMAKRGNSAYEKIYQFCKGFVCENGFHLNGDYKYYGYTQWHYRPFTLESSFGFCDALHEMLLQDHQGFIELFPAIPTEWQTGMISFKNLRSQGGILISAMFKNGAVVKLNVKSPSARTATINGKTYELKKGNNALI